MERKNKSFQFLKLKVASEMVRSSQAMVAFSRAFYLEEVLIDKISNEIKESKQEFLSLQSKVEGLLKTADFQHSIIAETNLRILCSTIQTELDRQFNGQYNQIFKEFENRLVQAEARRQAKSSLLQNLSSNHLMLKFESLTADELREVQVPEFSCFINESDFALLEKLNEDWNNFRKGLIISIKSALQQIETERETTSNNHQCGLKNQIGNGLHTSNGNDTDEIGKTFANRSGSVLRKFSSLLRRGKKSQNFCLDECKEIF